MVGIERLVDEEEGGTWAAVEFLFEPSELLRSDEAFVAFGFATGFVAVENDGSQGADAEAVVHGGHPTELDGLLAAVAVVHVMVPEDMVARAGEFVPSGEVGLIGGGGPAEVAELEDEIDFGLDHGIDELADPFDTPGEHIGVDISDHAEADEFFGGGDAEGLGGRGESGRGSGEAGYELSAADALGKVRRHGGFWIS